MRVTRSSIIERVKVCMEELTPYWQAAFEQTEGVAIERYIDGKIDETLRLLLLSAPVAQLPVTCSEPPPTPLKRQDGSGRIVLADDVLRPLSLQMAGWRKPVTRFIDESHPLYELQFNRYTRGGVAKPVAVFMRDGAGRRVIDYFSLPASCKEHRVSSFLYVAEPVTGATGYDLQPLLVDALCYRCAATVYDIMGNHAMAEVMLSHVTM